MRFGLADILRLLPGRRASSCPHVSDGIQPDEFCNWDNCNPETNGEYFLIDQCAGSWRLCFDVGANTGEYAARVLRANPDCRVHCFEPNRLLHDAIRQKGVTTVSPAALSDCAGTLRINFDTGDSTQSSIHRTHERCQAADVPAVTVDDYMNDNGIEQVSFVKIDTEGHELAVLRGAAAALRDQRIEMLQFEYGGTYCDAGTTLWQVYELLADNYLVCHLFPQGVLPMTYSEKLETFRYSNWVAISRRLQTGGGMAGVP